MIVVIAKKMFQNECAPFNVESLFYFQF